VPANVQNKVENKKNSHFLVDGIVQVFATGLLFWGVGDICLYFL